MTRITYRLRTEPIYLTITIILMSHSSLHTHIPECNSSMTHNQILCRSNHPHPSLTTTLRHCIITLLQEKPATLHQPQCTENQDSNLHTLASRQAVRKGEANSDNRYENGLQFNHYDGLSPKTESYGQKLVTG